MSQNAVISVIGKDRKGIVYGISKILFESGINILDISQKIMGNDLFAMIMLVDLKDATVDFHALQESMEKLGKELTLSIKATHEDIYKHMHRL